MQEDLPLVERPFAAYGELIGCDEATVLELLERFKARKLMRRFAAVMNHRSAGFKANAMGVWAVPDDRLDEVGPQMAGFALVSHCYRRPTYDDWPYSVFTMVHGKNAKECEATIAAVHDETGIDEYALLWSVKEYKKTRVRYFTDEWDAWRREHLALAPGLGGAAHPDPDRRRGGAGGDAGVPRRRAPQQRRRVAPDPPRARRRDRAPRARGAGRRLRGGRRRRRAVGRGVRLGGAPARRVARRDRAARQRDARLGHGLLRAGVDVRARRRGADVDLGVREQRHRLPARGSAHRLHRRAHPGRRARRGVGRRAARPARPSDGAAGCGWSPSRGSRRRAGW